MNKLNLFKKLSPVVFLLLVNCTSINYLPQAEVPNYSSLKENEQIVFLEAQLIEIMVLNHKDKKSGEDRVLSVIKQPSENPESGTVDRIILRYAITDKDNRVKRGVYQDFIADYLYPEKVAQDMNKKNKKKQKPTEHYINLPEKRIVYFKIKKDEKIRFDGAEYINGKESKRFQPTQYLFLSTLNKGRVKYAGSTLFIVNITENKNSKDKKNKWERSLKILPLKKSDDFIEKAVEIFNIPSISEIYDSKGKKLITK